MKKYGFYTERYSDTFEVETLMTGDGKAQFSDVKYPDGDAGISIAYGVGEGIGTQTVHNRIMSEDMAVKWQIKFENQRSVDAMIKALLEVKNHLSESTDKVNDGN